MEDFEVIVIDGNSSDGSWEFFQAIAASDNRFRIFQEEPNGIYDAWNKGIERCRGTYIHIATSDDTMVPECLQKLVTALRAHQGCGFAQCQVYDIDSRGEKLETGRASVAQNAYFGDLAHQAHIRYAPHDALLHALGGTVYFSISQLLVRRSVARKIGSFGTDWGTIADFEWGLRLSMAHDVVYLAEPLVAFRWHAAQASANVVSAESHETRLLNLIRHAAANAKSECGGGEATSVSLKVLETPLRFWEFVQEWHAACGIFKKLVVATAWLSKRPDIVVKFAYRRIFVRKRGPFDGQEWVQAEFRRRTRKPWFTVIAPKPG